MAQKWQKRCYCSKPMINAKSKTVDIDNNQYHKPWNMQPSEIILRNNFFFALANNMVSVKLTNTHKLQINLSEAK